jgi:hypothetical protein
MRTIRNIGETAARDGRVRAVPLCCCQASTTKIADQRYADAEDGIPLLELPRLMLAASGSADCRLLMSAAG